MMPGQPPENRPLDGESEALLSLLTTQEKLKANRVPGVRTVLVVLSSAGMVFDTDSLRQKILLTYTDAAVFFRTTSGKALGVESPNQIDLLIDLTGPRQSQNWFYPRRLRSMARVAIGRNAGWFRSGIYDRLFDEKNEAAIAPVRIPTDKLARERFVQREVLALAGVALAPLGSPTVDRAHSIALELPAMQRL